MTVAPTHLVARPADRKSMCGIKHPVPSVWVFWAGAHVNGHGMTVCPACWELAGGELVDCPGAASVVPDTRTETA